VAEELVRAVDQVNVQLAFLRRRSRSVSRVRPDSHSARDAARWMPFFAWLSFSRIWRRRHRHWSMPPTSRTAVTFSR